MQSKPDRECYDRAAEMIRSGEWWAFPLDGVIVSGKRRVGRILGRPNRRGYVQLSVRIEGRERLVSLHRVMWEYVHGPILDPDLVINHLDGDPANNRIDNLELVRQVDNMRHADRVLRRQVRGERVAQAKLTASDVRAIRESTDSLTVTAKRYGIARSGVSRIRQRKLWAHVA